MGQKLGGLFGRVQGKRQLRVICDRIYNECVEEGTHPTRSLLAFDDLHRATLLVFNVLNREFPGPHKEPPSSRKVRATIEDFRRKWVHEALDREEFYQIILEWASKDLHRLFVTKVCLAIAAAPCMVQTTKNVGKNVPRVGKVVDKIPTPVLASLYIIGFVLLQDLRVLV